MQRTNGPIPSIFQPYDFRNQLIVALLGPDGKTPVEMQSLSQWMHGQRNPFLVANELGHQLMDILTTDLDLVDVNEEDQALRLKVVLTPDPNISAMRLLGKIAEALVVRKCNQDLMINRRWAMHARKGCIMVGTPDEFVAVGTGLEMTRYQYPTKYSPIDTQRDIIWLHKIMARQELNQMARTGTTASIAAGIQLKVSSDGCSYVLPDLLVSRYEVPLVYFDLANDYDKVANNLYHSGRGAQIGVDLIRGRSIDPEIHDTLVSYYHLVLALLSGEMHLEDLFRERTLLDSYTKELHELQGKRIIGL